MVTSVTLSDNSALPGSITFDGTSTVNVQENTFTATGVYRVKVTVHDPKTLITDSTLEFDVTVLCTKSIAVLTNPIPATIIYTINTSVLMTTSLTVPTYEPTPNGCTSGTWTYSVALDPVAAFPPFITQNPTTTIDVATTNAAQSGIYNFRITATESISGFTNADVTFQV